MMEEENSEISLSRVDNWLQAHKHKGGKVFESAKEKYENVLAAKERNKNKRTFEDFNNDELVEVFGKDKNGQVRAMGSNISRKKLTHLGVAKSKLEQHKKSSQDLASLKDEIISLVDSHMDNFEGLMQAILSKMTTKSPTVVNSPVRYSPHMPFVLKGLNCTFLVGIKIGIVEEHACLRGRCRVIWIDFRSTQMRKSALDCVSWEMKFGRKNLSWTLLVWHLLATSTKLCVEILATTSDGLLSIDDLTGRCVLQDALQILACKEMQINQNRTFKSSEIDDDGEGGAVQAAKGRVVTHIAKKNLIQNAYSSNLSVY